MSMASLARCHTRLGSDGPTFRCLWPLLIIWCLVDIGVVSGTTKTTCRSPLLLLLHGVSAFAVGPFSGMHRDPSWHAHEHHPNNEHPSSHFYPKTTRLRLPPLLKALVMSMDDSMDDSRRRQRISVDGSDVDTNVTAMSNGVVDCQLSPRQWLESQDVDGAYTVIRCEYGSNNRTTTSSSNSTSNSNFTNGRQWTMAGIDFHLQRLHQSYQQLLLQKRQDQSTPTLVTEPKEASMELSQPLLSTNNDDIDTARRQTEIVVGRLLGALFELKQQPESYVTTGSPVAMVTILWQPPTRAINETFATDTNRNAMIRVQGHATFVPSSSTTLEHVPPITVAVAMAMKTCRVWQPQQEPQYQQHSDDDDDDDDMGDDALGVNRQPFPQAKLSAWCRQRRPLEAAFLGRQRLLLSHVAANSNADDTPAASWHDDVDIHEVILTNHTGTACSDSHFHHDHHDDVLLLEGLTSNLFVVYPNRVIRTAGSGVLAGYARHLVAQIVRDDGALLDNSSSCCSSRSSRSSSSWTLDTTTPIRLEDAKQWQEVFVTSAIRLIVPVGRVVVPCGTTVDEHGSVRRVFQTAWSADDNQREENHYTPIWTTLYDLIHGSIHVSLERCLNPSLH